MAKRVSDRVYATIIEIPEDSPAECVPRTGGELEVWESEHKFPGKKGAYFIYSGTDVLKYLKTSFSYDLTIEKGIVSFEKEGRCYRFSVDDKAQDKLADCLLKRTK